MINVQIGYQIRAVFCRCWIHASPYTSYGEATMKSLFSCYSYHFVQISAYHISCQCNPRKQIRTYSAAGKNFWNDLRVLHMPIFESIKLLLIPLLSVKRMKRILR